MSSEIKQVMSPNVNSCEIQIMFTDLKNVFISNS